MIIVGKFYDFKMCVICELLSTSGPIQASYEHFVNCDVAKHNATIQEQFMLDNYEKET